MAEKKEKQEPITAQSYAARCGASRNQIFVVNKLYSREVKLASEWKKIFTKDHTNIKSV